MHRPETAWTRAGRQFAKALSQVLKPESASQFHIASHAVYTPNLPEAFEGFRIVQLSDIHFYEYSCSDYYERMVAAVNALDADLIVTTGDIIHYGSHYLDFGMDFLNRLTARYGKWGCLGNHDYIDGSKSHGVLEMKQQAGFTMLVNEAAPIEKEGKRLWLSGIDDIKMSRPDLDKALKPTERNVPHIALAHNPKLAPHLATHEQAPDLILAGHTHGGQIDHAVVNFIHRHVFQQPFMYGWFSLGPSTLYVTSGIGSASVAIHTPVLDFALYPFRVNTTPEIVVMDLTSQPVAPVRDQPETALVAA